MNIVENPILQNNVNHVVGLTRVHRSSLRVWLQGRIPRCMTAVRADVIGNLVERRFCATSEEHTGTLIGEGTSHCPADRAACTVDDSHLVLQQQRRNLR